MIRAEVRLDLHGLAKFRRLAGQSDGPVRDMLLQWGARYRGFIQRRFATYSKGGGDWPPLAASTIARRRRGKGRRRVAILRDTGTLFASLDPTFQAQPGAVQEVQGLSVVVGFGGPAEHPRGNGVTIAAIAAFHQRGGPNLPKREIIVLPDQRTLDGMVRDAERALRKMADGI